LALLLLVLLLFLLLLLLLGQQPLPSTGLDQSLAALLLKGQKQPQVQCCCQSSVYLLRPAVLINHLAPQVC
jgi:hypothetical protein